MEAKLIKDRLFLKKIADNYTLHRIKDGILTIEGDSHYTIKGIHPFYKLSLKNCQAIELGYDLDELAYEYDLDAIENVYGQVKAFKAGFQKALELMGDKKFSEDFLKRMCSVSFNFYKRNDLSDSELEEEWENWLKNTIQSLQQTEWDVEIKMDDVWDGLDSTRIFPKEETSFPKLDVDGCLILKRI